MPSISLMQHLCCPPQHIVADACATKHEYCNAHATQEPFSQTRIASGPVPCSATSSISNTQGQSIANAAFTCDKSDEESDTSHVSPEARALRCNLSGFQAGWAEGFQRSPNREACIGTIRLTLRRIEPNRLPIGPSHTTCGS